MAIQGPPKRPFAKFHVPIEAHKDDKGRIVANPLKREDYDDRPPYIRKPLSNYEGYKRLDAALGKLEARDKAREKVCDVCHRRTRAWRVVPSLDGHIIPGPAARFGPVLVCCDNGPEGCAATLTRAGVAKKAIDTWERMAALSGRMGIVRGIA